MTRRHQPFCPPAQDLKLMKITGSYCYHFSSINPFSSTFLPLWPNFYNILPLIHLSVSLTILSNTLRTSMGLTAELRTTIAAPHLVIFPIWLLAFCSDIPDPLYFTLYLRPLPPPPQLLLKKLPEHQNNCRLRTSLPCAKTKHY